MDALLSKTDDDDPIEGNAEEFEDRNSLIDAVINRMKSGNV
jgi:hypothetical protein